MEHKIHIKECAKPLTPLQKQLTEGLVPSGDIYALRIHGTEEHPMPDKAHSWLEANGWGLYRDEVGCDAYFPPNKGNVMYLPHPSDPASVIQCVLDDKNLNSFMNFVREDKDLSFTMMNHRGKAYNLTQFEYAMLFHKKQEVIDEWMKLQVEKAPAMTPNKLAEQFRMEGFIERPRGLHFGGGFYDKECEWARMEIQNLVDRGELVLKNTRDRDGYGVVRLALPEQKEPEWKDLSHEYGSFRIAKETDTEMVILSMDDCNHVLAKAEPFNPNKKPKIVYKGKSLNEGMRAAENYIQKKPIISR